VADYMARDVLSQPVLVRHYNSAQFERDSAPVAQRIRAADFGPSRTMRCSTERERTSVTRRVIRSLPRPVIDRELPEVMRSPRGTSSARCLTGWRSIRSTAPRSRCVKRSTVRAHL
jgi:hypothetical protein